MCLWFDTPEQSLSTESIRIAPNQMKIIVGGNLVIMAAVKLKSPRSVCVG